MYYLSFEDTRYHNPSQYLTSFNGRFELKNSLLPSGEKAGSMSLYLPENQAVSGFVHRLFIFCE